MNITPEIEQAAQVAVEDQIKKQLAALRKRHAELAERAVAEAAGALRGGVASGSPPPLPQMMTKPQVLRALGVSYTTLWNYIRRGAFPRGTMIGMKVCWKTEAVSEWIEAQPKQQLKKAD